MKSIQINNTHTSMEYGSGLFQLKKYLSIVKYNFTSKYINKNFLYNVVQPYSTSYMQVITSVQCYRAVKFKSQSYRLFL